MAPDASLAPTARRRVLLIGWDAADWNIIRPLVAAGRMPVLARFLADGVSGNLATVQPPLSPLLWTSIATGKRPFKHGILGFTELDPLTGSVRPVTSLSRRCRALWNMLQLQGLRSLVVGWWPSHPAEPISGCMVSNQFQIAPGPLEQPWPVPRGAVHPDSLAESLAGLRIHPHQLDSSHLLPFVPRAAEIDQSTDPRLHAIARNIAECTTLHGVATALMQNEPWDFTALYLDAIDHFSHGFMRYHAPGAGGVNERDAAIYREVVEAAYIYHDMMLGTLLQVAGESTTVLLVSDHGFHSGGRLPAALPLEPAGPAAEHRHHGILAARGPGIPKGGEALGAGILDVCPTILALFGLPVGADMDGKPLPELSAAYPPLRSIPSWEEVPGNDGGHPAGTTASPQQVRTAIDQLAALGYIEPPSGEAAEDAEKTSREVRYNLAQSYMDAGRYHDALPILEELDQAHPQETRFGTRMVACHHALGAVDRVRDLTRSIVCRRLRDGRAARLALADAPPDSENLPRLRARARVDHDALRHFMAFADFSCGDFQTALDRLDATSPAYRARPDVRNTRAEMLLRLRRWQDASAEFQTVLACDPDNASAWRGIARACLGRRDFEGAIEAALASLRLVFDQPLAHFLLGMACYRAGRIEHAAQAFRVTARLNPSHAPAYRMLSEIHHRHLGDGTLGGRYALLAHEARRKLRGARERNSGPAAPTRQPRLPSFDPADPTGCTADPKNTIVIVSGLPRSGTSMMMQMLAAGGLTPFTDGSRPADASNPYGYFEHDKVLELVTNNHWLAGIQGRAIKIVAPLLPFIPMRDEQGQPLHYRVLFMRRPLAEILSSQERMLQRPAGDLAPAYSDQFVCAHDFLRQHRIPAIEIDYQKTLDAPTATAERIREFLAMALDTRRMSGAVRSHGRA